MTATLPPAPRAPIAAPAASSSAAADLPVRTGRARWPLFGVAGGLTAAAAFMVSSQPVKKEDIDKGVDVLDQLHRGQYHAGFLLGLVSVACLLMASAGWRRWAERRAPEDLAARTIGQGIALTAAINVIFYALMGSMAIYLDGGSDAGWLSKQAIFVNFTLLDFGGLLGFWTTGVAAVCVAVLALRKRDRLLPKWMGIVSIVLLLPALGLAVGTGLPGFIGLTMTVWLVVISAGLHFSKTAQA